MDEKKQCDDARLRKEEVELQPLLDYFVTWWKFILLCVVLGGAAGAVLSYRAPSELLTQAVVEPAWIAARTGHRLFFTPDQMADSLRRAAKAEGGDGAGLPHGLEIQVNKPAETLTLSMRGPTAASQAAIRTAFQLLQQDKGSFLKREQARRETERAKRQSELGIARSAGRRLEADLDAYARIMNNSLKLADAPDSRMSAKEYLDLLSEYRRHLETVRDYEQRRRELAKLEATLSQEIADIDSEAGAPPADASLGPFGVRELNPDKELPRMVATYAVLGLLAGCVLSVCLHASRLVRKRTTA